MGRAWQAERQSWYNQGLINISLQADVKESLRAAICLSLAHTFSLHSMLFFTSLLHDSGNRDQKALTGKANLNRSCKGFCLPGSSKNKAGPSGKMSWKPRG